MTKKLFLPITLLTLTACAGPANDNSPEASARATTGDLAVPKYALFTGYSGTNEVYEVSCGRNNVAVADVAYFFYNRDGSMKSQQQFCRENNSASRIR